jgi:predicted O-methyltransferase YrrM
VVELRLSREAIRQIVRNFAQFAGDIGKSNELAAIQQGAEQIPGWRSGAESKELARLSFALDPGAVIVEIGSFLGRGAVLLAGPRKLRGSGRVHCVDPFDGSGDAFSVPHYEEIQAALGGGSLRQHFDDNIARLGLQDWIEVHPGRQEEVVANWREPIDLLLLDGDQSPAGARSAYDNWLPFLKAGGVIAVANSDPREYARGHDGYRRVAAERLASEDYSAVWRVGSLTMARRR